MRHYDLRLNSETIKKPDILEGEVTAATADQWRRMPTRKAHALLASWIFSKPVDKIKAIIDLADETILKTILNYFNAKSVSDNEHIQWPDFKDDKSFFSKHTGTGSLACQQSLFYQVCLLLRKNKRKAL